MPPASHRVTIPDVPRLRPIHLALLLILAAALAAILSRGRSVREDRTEVLRALRQAQGPSLPEPSSVGAVSRTEPARHDRDSLHELIDGAAEAYLGRGFERSLSSTYLFTGSPSIEIAAEAYRFSGSEGALGQLAAERPASAGPVPGIPGAVSTGSVLLTVSGRDLLKLTSLVPDSTGRGALVTLARAWAKEKSP